MKRLMMLAGACALSAPLLASAQSAVIASAGQASVTQTQMTTLLKSLDAETRERLAADPASLDQLVRARLAQSVVVAEVKAKGWDQQPEVKQMVEQAERDTLMRSYLASVAAPPANYPSDAEVQAAYDQNRTAFSTPRALHFAQIYIAVPPDADAATRAKSRKQADDLARQAHAGGADFAALAAANSQDKPSASQGGDMGFVPEGVLLPEIRKAADSMKPGDISAPIQTAAGFHVMKLVDVRAAGVRPLADVKDQLRAMLRRQRTQQNVQAYLAKQVGPGTVAINEDALKKALSAAQ
ncbi:putative parvulin-type peptidyl-prolyl cis-trans isomerase [Paraburkholderia sediminicola]|uniref:Putative parvulin-type peptidyl-prolyl cis-trans isomerase n=1 Tax=Paraburkholderia sediminicola TaxID=458836 RepID=A0A6J4ZUP2_9BURK|nr:peptidylprolyl isomerase [Paraburkholderia sediminicola]CAB3643397.1 putative parvulin-type peptidyl-prolyl cis-trans isomerase [Paraburkholderia sediminicola]